MEKEQEVRRVLGPLAQLADELGVTFLLIMHFNKRGDVNALHRVMGAVAMSGVARAVWLCALDPDDEENCLFLCAKMNIARPPKGLQYQIAEKQLNVGPFPFIVWKGPTDFTADRALSPARGDDGQLTSAKTWLETFLVADMPAVEVYEAAKAAGISERTLKRAKSSLEIESAKTMDGWVWLARSRGTGVDGDVLSLVQ